MGIKLEPTGRTFGCAGEQGRRRDGSDGRGTVSVMCKSMVPRNCPPARVRIAVGSGARAEPFRGPVQVNFSQRTLVQLPEPEKEWDFRGLLDDAGMLTVVV